MKISELKEKYPKLYAEACKYTEAYGIYTIEDDPALYNAFGWSSTSQGHSFWSTVNQKSFTEAKEIYPSLFEEESVDPNVFPKGTYVVLLGGSDGLDTWEKVMPINHVYKLQEASKTSYFNPEKDVRGYFDNSWSVSVCFPKILQKPYGKLKLREATTEEKTLYEALENPCSIDILESKFVVFNEEHIQNNCYRKGDIAEIVSFSGKTVVYSNGYSNCIKNLLNSDCKLTKTHEEAIKISQEMLKEFAPNPKIVSEKDVWYKKGTEFIFYQGKGVKTFGFILDSFAYYFDSDWEICNYDNPLEQGYEQVTNNEEIIEVFVSYINHQQWYKPNTHVKSLILDSPWKLKEEEAPEWNADRKYFVYRNTTVFDKGIWAEAIEVEEKTISLSKGWYYSKKENILVFYKTSESTFIIDLGAYITYNTEGTWNDKSLNTILDLTSLEKSEVPIYIKKFLDANNYFPIGSSYTSLLGSLIEVEKRYIEVYSDGDTFLDGGLIFDGNTFLIDYETPEPFKLEADTWYKLNDCLIYYLKEEEAYGFTSSLNFYWNSGWGRLKNSNWLKSQEIEEASEDLIVSTFDGYFKAHPEKFPIGNYIKFSNGNISKTPIESNEITYYYSSNDIFMDGKRVFKDGVFNISFEKVTKKDLDLTNLETKVFKTKKYFRTMGEIYSGINEGMYFKGYIDGNLIYFGDYIHTKLPYYFCGISSLEDSFEILEESEVPKGATIYTRDSKKEEVEVEQPVKNKSTKGLEEVELKFLPID